MAGDSWRGLRCGATPNPHILEVNRPADLGNWIFRWPCGEFSGILTGLFLFPVVFQMNVKAIQARGVSMERRWKVAKRPRRWCFDSSQTRKCMRIAGFSTVNRTLVDLAGHFEDWDASKSQTPAMKRDQDHRLYFICSGRFARGGSHRQSRFRTGFDRKTPRGHSSGVEKITSFGGVTQRAFSVIFPCLVLPACRRTVFGKPRVSGFENFNCNHKVNW